MIEAIVMLLLLNMFFLASFQLITSFSRVYNHYHQNYLMYKIEQNILFEWQKNYYLYPSDNGFLPYEQLCLSDKIFVDTKKNKFKYWSCPHITTGEKKSASMLCWPSNKIAFIIISEEVASEFIDFTGGYATEKMLQLVKNGQIRYAEYYMLKQPSDIIIKTQSNRFI